MKVTAKIYIQAGLGFSGELSVEAFSIEMPNRITLAVKEFDIEVADLTLEQFNSRMAKKLNEQKKVILQDAAQKISVVDEQISKLVGE